MSIEHHKVSLDDISIAKVIEKSQLKCKIRSDVPDQSP